MRKFFRIGAGLLSLTLAAFSADNAEQVVFSATGAIMNLSGNSTAASTPFGFWIWCAADAAANSNGGYQTHNACQGSMYFYGLDKNSTSVIGQVSEGPDGIYTMHVVQGTAAQLFSGTLNPAYSCSLTNTTPDPKGPGNTINVSCMFLSAALGGGTGAATVTNAVANVTGPK